MGSLRLTLQRGGAARRRAARPLGGRRTDPDRAGRADAETLATGGWLLPGLVDAHCHVGLEMQRRGARRRGRTARAGRAGRRGAAAAGRRQPGRHPLDGRAGRTCPDHPGRTAHRPARSATCATTRAEVEPDELVAEVERQAARGDGWIKLVGDWIDREVGDLAPLWPAEVAAAAIARAHELGCRVTAHVFGEQAVAELVAAGIDGIEHGTGIDDATIAIDGRAPGRAGADDDPARQLRATTPRRARPSFPRTRSTSGRCTRRRLERFGRAPDAGVPIYAGTDAGGYLPHGLVGTGDRGPGADSARRSTRSAPAPGGPGPGSAAPTGWWRARRRTWSSSTATRVLILVC